jgi:hypothetical protein
MSPDANLRAQHLTYNNHLNLIAEHYRRQGELHRAELMRQGTLAEAIHTVLNDLGNLSLLADLSRLDAARAEDRARSAEKRLAVLTQPMAPELARLDACIKELDARLDNLRIAARDGVAALFKALREMPTGFGDLDELPPLDQR